MSRSACSRRAASRSLGTQTSGPSPLLGLYPSLRSIRAVHDGCALPGTDGKVSGVGAPRPVDRLCAWLGQARNYQYCLSAGSTTLCRRNWGGSSAPASYTIPGDRHMAPQGVPPLWSLWAQSIYYTPSFPTFQALSVFARSDAWLDYFGKGLLPLPEKRVYQEAFFTPGI